MSAPGAPTPASPTLATRLAGACIGRRRALRFQEHFPPLRQRFGRRRALRLSRRILWPDRGLAEVRVPGFAEPLALRAATSDIPTFEQVFVNEEYALPFVQLEPALVIDAGANIGLSVRYLAARFPTARIVAVEPEASNFALMRRNTRSLGSLTLLHAAVWNRETPLRIVNPGDEHWAFQVAEAATGDVAAVTIGALLSSVSAADGVVVKLDIEGAEVEVLDASAASWMPKVAVLIVELHDRFRPGCSDALRKSVAGLGFREFQSGENVVLVRDAV
jgi:FkbM family methyltransferase